MVLKVLLKFPPTLVLVHGWLFPVNAVRGRRVCKVSSRTSAQDVTSATMLVYHGALMEYALNSPKKSKKPLTRVSKPVPGAHGKRGLERGWQKRLAKGWRRVGKGLAKGWQKRLTEKVGEGLAKG